MAISYLGGKEPYVQNHTRARKLLDGYVVTNDYGSWAYLDESEFKSFQQQSISEPLLSMLKEKGLVITEENYDSVINDYRKKMAYLFQGASLHIVVPTLRCNHNCTYCHAKAKPESAEGFDMTLETARKTVDFIMQSPSNAITIEFQGGEPLLRYDLVRYIVEYATRKNEALHKSLGFTVVTNLTHMDENILAYFKKRSVGICTSLDGPAIVHDKNRQAHAKTVEWIKRIRKEYSINAMMLVTKQSLKYPKEIVDEYFDLGLSRIWIKPVNRIGNALENWDRVGITGQEYLTFYKKALDEIVKRNSEKKFVERHTQILLQKILTKDCVNFTDLESPCGAAIGQLAYSYDGSVYTCDEGRLYELFKLGTVDQKYTDVVASSATCAIVKASINDNPVCEVCAYKPFCGLCPVCSYAETGNVLSKLPNRRCEILIGMFDHVFGKLVSDERFRKAFLDWVNKLNSF